jgi:hypothetical protein
MSKTIKEWLNLLPEPYKTQSLTNLNPDKGDIVKYHMEDALVGAFTWETSLEGSSYWVEITDKVFKGEIEPINDKEKVYEQIGWLLNDVFIPYENIQLNEMNVLDMYIPVYSILKD